jgi:hypothetical protein
MRFIVWSSSKGQTPVQSGLNGRGNVTGLAERCAVLADVKTTPPAAVACGQS